MSHPAKPVMELGCHHIRKQEAGNPELITHLNALAGADLELPLRGHDLGVGTGDVDTSVQAGLVVGLDDVTLDDLAGADTAVVWTLGSREAVRGLDCGSVLSCSIHARNEHLLRGRCGSCLPSRRGGR